MICVRLGSLHTSPAVRGCHVCRFHGAGGGQPAGKAHSGNKHGLRSREWVEMRKKINELVREARKIESMLSGDAL